MKEEPTRDGGIRWMSWVLAGSKNVQRTDDAVVAVTLFCFYRNNYYFSYNAYRIIIVMSNDL